MTHTSDLVATFDQLKELSHHEQKNRLKELETSVPSEELKELSELLGAWNESQDFLNEGPDYSVKKIMDLSPINPSESVAPLKSGDQIKNFRIIREVGRGSSAVVYLAYDLHLNRQVAIKIIRGKSREAQTRSELMHVNIVRLYEERSDLIPEHIALVMEYAEGPTLEEYLECYLRQPRSSREILHDLWNDPINDLRGIQHYVDETFSLSPLQQIQQSGLRYLEALEYAHKKGILHLDVKPANIIITPPFARPMITDFNVSIHSQVEENGHQVRGGTLDYMAPEQKKALLGEVPFDLDGRTDLYSVAAVMKKHKEVIVEHIPRSEEPFAKALEKIIDRGLSLRREERFANATEMISALRAIESLNPVEARKVSRFKWDVLLVALQVFMWVLALTFPKHLFIIATTALVMGLGSSIFLWRHR